MLLRLLNARLYLAAAALAGGLYAAARWGGHVVAAYEAARYPSSPVPTGQDISLELERKESARLRFLHAKVAGEIEAAAARGAKVDGLRRAADNVLSLDRKGYRRHAFQQLQALRLAVPPPREQFRPAADNEGEESLRTPRSRPGPRRKRR